MTTIEVYTRPIPVNRIVRCVGGRNILSKEYREVKPVIQQEIALEWKNELLTGNVTVNIIHYFKNKVHGDIDAYIKILLDAMEGVVYENDKQITELSVIRQYDKQNPRTLIQIL